ncbi:MAG: class I SAM-dependent methyltransferase [Terriglobales bacterium]
MNRRQEVARLADWCRVPLGSGATIAEVGAGDGAFARECLHWAGPTGRVFATELEGQKHQQLCRRLSRQGGEIGPVASTAATSGLPVGECDAVVLRAVYHHFTQPRAMAADLFAALRPGGALAIVDFPARWWLTLFSRPKDVPADRGGHGVPAVVVGRELTAAGFALERDGRPWRWDFYCSLFRKPGVAPQP